MLFVIECAYLVEIDVSNVDTKNMSYMCNFFYGCKNLKVIKGLKKWNTENFKDISAMFYGCERNNWYS